MTGSSLEVFLVHVEAERTIPKDYFPPRPIKFLTQMAGSIICHIMKLQSYFWTQSHILIKLT